MRLLICAGGTGGGVYPALSVLRALGDNAVDVLWVGGQNGMETDLVQRAGIPFTAIPAAGVHGIGIRSLPKNLYKIGRGIIASRRILNQFKPDVLFFTGGFVAVPMALAGRNIPSLVFVPDIEPGLALRFLVRSAKMTAVSTEDSIHYFSKKTRIVQTGYPTRSELKTWNSEIAIRHFGLESELPILLIAGGSSGARSINHAILNVLNELLKICQVIHISGKLDWAEVQDAKDKLDNSIAGRYHSYPYLHEDIGAAFACANLVISRAGASTLGEYPLFGLPAILVPYPHAWRYQKVNADYLQKHGSAIVIEDDQLPNRLLLTVKEFITDANRLENMSQAMMKLATPDSASHLAELIKSLGKTSPIKTEGLLWSA